MEHIAEDYPQSQYLNLSPHTEFDLAEAFARRCGDDFAYLASRGQWFCRAVGDDGSADWKPDEQLQVFFWIRLVLRDLAGRSSPAICTAAAVRAVEELARAELCITEEDLVPGALAKADALTEKFMECFRRDSDAKKAAEAPAQPPQPTKKKAKPFKPGQPKPKPKPANPAPTVDNAQTTTAPRSLIDDMARWAAVGSAA